MPRYKTVSEKNGGLSLIAGDGGELLVTCTKMSWESDFFSRKFGKLEMGEEVGAHFEEAGFLDALETLLAVGDKEAYDLIEIDLDISLIDRVSIFEDKGFRLVDIKVTFISYMRKSEILRAKLDFGEICLATEEMKGGILELTHQSFTNNPLFKSRFTQRRYFSYAETRRYYSAWIENHMSDKDNVFAVMKDKEGKPVAYLVYRRKGNYQGKPLYKGVLVAVAPEHRGRKIHRALQAFVYRRFSENEVYLEITTQLANLSAIKNYIRPYTILDQVELVLYRKKV